MINKISLFSNLYFCKTYLNIEINNHRKWGNRLNHASMFLQDGSSTFKIKNFLNFLIDYTSSGKFIYKHYY